MKRRIVHFITSLERGGAQAVLKDICLLAGYEHHVLYIHDGPIRHVLEESHISTHCVRGFFTTYDPLLIIRLYRLLKKMRPDCVHTILWSANLVGRIVCHMLRIPMVASLHNNIEQNGMVRNQIERWVPAYGAMIAVSQQVRTSYQAHFGPCAIQVIHNGITPLAYGANSVSRSALGLADSDFVIGSVGRFEVVKRYDVLLDAMAVLVKKYPHVKLLVLGSGSQELALQALADRLGITRETIFVINQLAHSYYHLFDCFVMASLKEGISIALLEAMSAGIGSIVASDSVHHSVITHGENGLLAYPGLREDLVQCIEKFITNENIRSELAQAGKDLVVHSYAHGTMMHEYDFLFQSIMRRNANSV